MKLSRFESSVNKVNKFSEFLLVVSVLIIFVILLAQIFSRFVFFVPLPSSQDLLIFFLLVSVFLGVGNAVSQNKQIALEFFVNALPKQVENAILFIADLISILFLIIVIYQAAFLMIETKGSTVGSSPVPVPYYYLAIAVGCFLMIINYVSQLLNKVNMVKRREEK